MKEIEEVQRKLKEISEHIRKYGEVVYDFGRPFLRSSKSEEAYLVLREFTKYLEEMKKLTPCPKCKIGKMKPGKALIDILDGTPDFIGDDKVVTISPSGKAKMVEVYKCDKCGYSISK